MCSATATATQASTSSAAMTCRSVGRERTRPVWARLPLDERAGSTADTTHHGIRPRRTAVDATRRAGRSHKGSRARTTFVTWVRTRCPLCERGRHRPPARRARAPGLGGRSRPAGRRPGTARTGRPGARGHGRGRRRTCGHGGDQSGERGLHPVHGHLGVRGGQLGVEIIRRGVGAADRRRVRVLRADQEANLRQCRDSLLVARLLGEDLLVGRLGGGVVAAVQRIFGGGESGIVRLLDGSLTRAGRCLLRLRRCRACGREAARSSSRSSAAPAARAPRR